jgi:hypothetical protein
VVFVRLNIFNHLPLSLAAKKAERNLPALLCKTLQAGKLSAQVPRTNKFSLIR